MKRIYSKPIDKYEEELEAFLNKGVYVPVEIQKNKSITLRVEGEDLTKVKVKAQKHGIPYQRIINMLINGYANNRIKLAI